MNPGPAWSRARDVAALVALLLAAPAVWLADGVAQSKEPALAVSGTIFELPDRTLWASTSPYSGQIPGLPDRTEALLYGGFQLAAHMESHGWPFVSSLRRRGTVSVRPVSGGGTRQPRRIEPGSNSAEGLAIEAALRQHGDRQALGVWYGHLPDVSHRWQGWLANAMVWAILLPLTAWLTMTLRPA